jgi:hypothetical protein
MMQSAVRPARKTERPSSNPFTIPMAEEMSVIVDRRPPAIETKANSRSTFRSDGSLNSEE